MKIELDEIQELIEQAERCNRKSLADYLAKTSSYLWDSYTLEAIQQLRKSLKTYKKGKS